MSAISDILAEPSAAVLDTEKPPSERTDPQAADTIHDEAVQMKDGTSPKEANYTSTTTSIRRNASGSVSSVYSGNKMKHLKKEDGIPLWRKDIQYDFLHLVFYDEKRCFTKYSDRTRGHTFAEIYIDAMAKSSKCSKVLKEKLLQDMEGAISMAMVCLLVNVGRMNTTLNFFPEMRAQLRTYHSIPALQANQDIQSYKQLQDAPRLKSILKGATEDEPQPGTIDEIKAAHVPRTNPVNLIFVMSNYAPKISELHFQSPRDFFDLVMRSTLSSQSRARAFLWLLWWYLESDFSHEDSQRNPFGPGLYMDGETAKDALPLKVPQLESLTEEQAAAENVDTEKEQTYGEQKRKVRIAILASEPSPAMTALKNARKEKGLAPSRMGELGDYSDDEDSESGWMNMHSTSMERSVGLNRDSASDYTRSPSPTGDTGPQAPSSRSADAMRSNNGVNAAGGVLMEMSPPITGVAATTKKGPGRGNWRRTKPRQDVPLASRPSEDRGYPIPLLPNTGQLNFVNEGPQQMRPPSPRNHRDSLGQSFVDDLTGQVPTTSAQTAKKHRPGAQHQSAVQVHRKQQVDYTLEKRIRKVHTRARDRRESEGSILRAWKRMRAMPIDYDSEEEKIKIRKAGERADKDEDWRADKRGKENVDTSEEAEAWRRPRVLLAGFFRSTSDPNDLGEDAKSMARAFRRCERRLERWSETTTPGDAIIRRRHMREQGYVKKRRREISGKEPSFQQDGLAIVQESVRPDSRRMRSSAGRAGSQIHTSTGIGVDVRMAIDGVDQGGELDEMDRKLLGEVDADETEDEDDDDDMRHD